MKKFASIILTIRCVGDHEGELSLHGNQFEGDLPKTLGQSTSIGKLLDVGKRMANDSYLTVKLSSLVLEKLLLDSNLLSGTIPDEWGGMTNLQTLALVSVLDWNLKSQTDDFLLMSLLFVQLETKPAQRDYPHHGWKYVLSSSSVA